MMRGSHIYGPDSRIPYLMRITAISEPEILTRRQNQDSKVRCTNIIEIKVAPSFR